MLLKIRFLPIIPSDRLIRGAYACKCWTIGARYTIFLPVLVPAFTSLPSWHQRKHSAPNYLKVFKFPAWKTQWKKGTKGYTWRHDRMRGIVCSWMRVGVVNPILFVPKEQWTTLVRQNFELKSNSIKITWKPIGFPKYIRAPKFFCCAQNSLDNILVAIMTNYHWIERPFVLYAKKIK